jgi:hypothetical protein
MMDWFCRLNYLYQPSVAVAGYLKNINVLSVKKWEKMIILHPVKII